MGNKQGTDVKRLLITGCDYGGKTAIIDTIIRAIKDLPPIPIGTLNQKPTHGLNIQFTIRNHLKLALYDMPGLPRHRHLWKSYFDFTDLIVFVVDMTNPKRLMEARSLLRGMVHNTTLSGVPVLVYCNKHDMRIRTDHHHIRRVLQLDDIRDRHWHIQECSAKTGYGLEVGMEWGCNELLKGRLSNRRRRIVTAPVTQRHKAMLRNLVEDVGVPLKLKTIQSKFEFLSGVLYGLSSLICALEDEGLEWQRTYSSSSEVVQERCLKRLKTLSLHREKSNDDSTAAGGESKTANDNDDDERAPLLSVSKPEPNSQLLKSPDPKQKPSPKPSQINLPDPDPNSQLTAAPATNLESTPLLTPELLT